MKRLIHIIVFALLPVTAWSGSGFELLTEKNVIKGKPVKVKYQVNDFYTTYYIYLNVVKALSLDKTLTPKELDRLFLKTKAGLEKTGRVQYRVPGYPGGELRVTLRTNRETKSNKPILLVASNYNVQSKRVVAGNDMAQAYATYFYLIHDKLVKFQIIRDSARKQQQAKRSTNSLADYYLLDGDKKNDAKGRNLLIKGIKKSKNPAERFVMHLTLSEYYLLEKNVKKAQAVLRKAETIAKEEIKDKGKREKLLMIHRYAHEILRYYTRYQNNS